MLEFLEQVTVPPSSEMLFICRGCGADARASASRCVRCGRAQRMAPPREIDPLEGRIFGDVRLAKRLGEEPRGLRYEGYDMPGAPAYLVKLVGSAAGEHEQRQFLARARAAQAPGAPDSLLRIHRSGRQSGLAYAAVEFVRGKTLAERGGKHPWPRVRKLGRSLARAVEAVHRHGAHLGGSDPLALTTVTRHGLRLDPLPLAPVDPTLRSAPPEMQAGEAPTPAADVYALSRGLLDICETSRVPVELQAALSERPLARPPMRALVGVLRAPERSTSPAGMLVSGAVGLLIGAALLFATTGAQQAGPGGTAFVPQPRLEVEGVAEEQWVSGDSVLVKGRLLNAPEGVDAVEIGGQRVPIDSKGAFQQRIPLSEEGRVALRVVGAEDASETLRVVRDTAKPVVKVQRPSADAVTREPWVLVEGRAGDPNLAAVFVEVGGRSIPAAVDAQGRFAARVDLDRPGATPLRVVARDRAGNEAFANAQVVWDTGSPGLTVLFPVEETSVLAEETVVLRGRLESPYPQTVKVQGEEVQLEQDGSFSTELKLARGLNVINLEGTDRAGTLTRVARVILRDDQPPSLVVGTPRDGWSVDEAEVLVTGSAVDMGAGTKSVQVGAFEAPLAANGAFELSAALLPGTNEIVVEAVDRAGNSTREVVKVYRKPRLELDAPPSQIRGSRGVVELHGRYSSAGGLPVVAGQKVQVISPGRFRVQIPLQPGQNDIELTLKDDQGHAATRTLRVTYSPDLPDDLSRGGDGGFLGSRDQAPLRPVTGGGFRMGASDGEIDERPMRRVELPTFLMDRHEVTNRQYAAFLAYMEETGDHSKCSPDEGPGKDHTPTDWGTEAYRNVSPEDDGPVVFVDWYDAFAYAAWAGRRLPTEAEWERSARGALAQRYPWGDDPKPAEGLTELGSVESVEHDRSPAGVRDQAGSVREWCMDFYETGFYRRAADVEPYCGRPSLRRVVRGSSGLDEVLPASRRSAETPLTRRGDLGFRCARSWPEGVPESGGRIR
jgi:formylglycine-generating enzyme required for sulfatase activity